MRDIKNWIKGNLYGCTMKPNDFVIFGVQRTAMSNKGIQKTYSYGYDGHNHAVFSCDEWYGVDPKKCVYAVDKGTTITGPCNKSCVNKQSKGFFIHHPEQSNIKR